MLYVIHNDYQSLYLKEVTKEMDTLVSKYSQHYEISVEAFRKQILNESMNIKKQKRVNMNEALGGLKKIQQKAQQAQIDPSERSDDEKQERLRKAELQGARALGQLEKILPELVANLEKFFPTCKMVKEYTAVMSSKNTYYVTEETHVVLNMDIDNSNIKDLGDACAVMTIDQIIGNVSIKNSITFKGFPVGFPKEIGGNLTLFNLPRMENFANAPEAVTGSVSINVGRKITPRRVDEYKNSLKGTLTPIDGQENKPKSIFTMNRRNNESVADIIKKRIALSESYINEMALPKKLSAFAPRKSKPQSGRDTDNDSYIASTELYKANINTLMDVIDPILPIEWGELSDDDISVIDDLSEVKESSRDSAYFEKNKDNINQLDYAGIKRFTTSDDIISAVYKTTKKASSGNKRSKYLTEIVYLTDDDGNPITDPDKIRDQIKVKKDILKQTYEFFKSVGIDFNNLTRSKNTTIEECILHILYYNMCILNGTSGAVDYKYKTKSIINDEYINGTSSDEDIFYNLFTALFGNYYRNLGNSYKVNGLTISFDQVNANQPIKKKNFNRAYYSSQNVSVYDLISDNVIKAFLIGTSVRGKDDYPKYSLEEIINADRSELLEMIKNDSDVELNSSTLKSMSFKGKDSDSTDPFDVLLLFPDKCEKEYAIRVDVDEEIKKRTDKKVTRDIYKSGMYTDIKDYKYNRATGERERADIKGTSSIKKASEDNESIELFNNAIDYLVSNKDVFDDVTNIISKAVDEQPTNKYGSALVSDVSDSIKTITQFADIINNKLMNEPEISENRPDAIAVLMQCVTQIYTCIENIITNADSADASDLCLYGAELVRETRRLPSIYANLVGEKNRYGDVVAKKVKKLSDRKKRTQDVNIDTTSTDKATIGKYNNIVDSIIDDSAELINVAKGIDFESASEDAIDYFGTKDDMIRRVNTQLRKSIEIANTIKSNNDVAWMNTLIPSLKNINDICSSILQSDNEELISDSLVELDSECRKISKISKSYGSTKGYSHAGGMTA